jgi:hypothetical protein
MHLPAASAARPARKWGLGRLLALAGVAAVLVGCALQPTPYQPLGETGGYEEAQLGERVYRVSFRGNRATPETAVLDFLFLRCAELTHRNGFTHFVIQEDFGRTQVSVRAMPRSSVGMGLGFGSGRSFWGLGFSGALGEPDYQSVVSYHLAVFVIRMLDDEEARRVQGAGQAPGAAQGQPQPQVYDADFLIRSLAPKKEASLRKDS